MTTLSLVLVLCAALCHATWNFFVKRIAGGPELVWLFSIIAALLYLPVLIFVLVTDRPTLGVPQITFILGSAVLHLAYFLLLQQGYRKGDLSLVYPTARATGPFLATVIAVGFLGEMLTLQVAAGGIAVIVGVLSLTGGLRRGVKGGPVSIVFGIGVGFLIASYTVWDAHAVSSLLVPPLLLDYASTVARITLLAPIAAKRKAAIKRHWREHRRGVIAIAVFSPLAYILVLYALTFTPVIYVAPLREVSVVLTVLLGSVVLGEGDLRRRMSWAVLILFGVALLATA